LTAESPSVVERQALLTVHHGCIEFQRLKDAQVQFRRIDFFVLLDCRSILINRIPSFAFILFLFRFITSGSALLQSDGRKDFLVDFAHR
jgi:hypothetical protein